MENEGKEKSLTQKFLNEDLINTELIGIQEYVEEVEEPAIMERTRKKKKKKKKKRRKKKKKNIIFDEELSNVDIPELPQMKPIHLDPVPKKIKYTDHKNIEKQILGMEHVSNEAQTFVPSPKSPTGFVPLKEKKKSVFLDSVIHIPRKKEVPKKKIPRRKKAGQKRKRKEREVIMPSNIEPEKQEAVPFPKKKKKKMGLESRHYVLLKRITEFQLNEIKQLVPEKEITKIKLYHPREKYYVFVSETYKYLFNKEEYKTKVLNVDTNIEDKRNIFISHVDRNVSPQELLKYFAEIGKVSVKSFKIKRNCYGCKGACKKFLLNFERFQSVLDSLDFSGTTIRGTPVTIKPTCIYENFIF